MIKIGFIIAAVLVGIAWTTNNDLEKAYSFMNDLYVKSSDLAHKIRVAKWELSTNDKANKEQLQKELDSFSKQFRQLISDSSESFKEYDWKSFTDEKLRRMYFIWSHFGDILLTESDQTELKNLESRINQLEGAMRIKDFNAPEGAPELTLKDTVKKITENYNKADALKHYWVEGYNHMGRPAKDKFIRWLEIKAKSAEANGFSNLLQYWQSVAEIEDYENTFIPLLNEIQPFFIELHAYFRHKLQAVYGNAVNPKGPIPDNLIIGMWTSLPDALWKKLLPFPDIEKNLPFDISSALTAQRIKGRVMVEKIDSFFESLGFEKYSTEFYENSFYDKRENSKCVTYAYDFADNKDYRIIACDDTTQANFIQTTESVCLSKWQQSFKNLPHYFKLVPTVSVNTAVISTVVNFINSPKYLKKTGLLDQNEQISKEMELNYLFKEAINMIFDIPYLISYDMWRWHVIKGEIQPGNFNCEYWRLRTKYQGVEPPVERDNNDFDTGANLYAIKGNQLIVRVLGRFMKYDITSELCKTAGYHPEPSNPESHLAFCDISESKEAGEKLREAMKLGDSVPFYKVLGRITGRDRLDSSGLLEYYKPLHDWLRKYNDDNNVERGWEEQQSKCH